MVNTEQSSEPSQAKIKFIEYVQSTNVHAVGNFYKADGTIDRPTQQQPDTGYQNLVDDETKLRQGENGCGKFAVPFGNTTFQLCKERERNLDTSGYIRNGAMYNRGFGNVDVFSQINFGEATRQVQGPAAGIENDRLHLTNRNYGAVANFAYPTDTRYVNKTYTDS